MTSTEKVLQCVCHRAIIIFSLLCRTLRDSLYLPRFLNSQGILDKGERNTSALIQTES